jgi:pantetheine-phosphate adenylyltransferase
MGMDAKLRRAVYAGSFDPPTNGHMWMISQGAALFDELVVAVGINPDKRCMFTTEERLLMLREMTKDLKNVKVTSFGNKFLMHYAKSIDASFILRGIRNANDYHYESGIQLVNENIEKGIGTVVLMPPPDIGLISSSLIKGLLGPEGWQKVVKRYVPDCVYDELLKQFHASTDLLKKIQK